MRVLFVQQDHVSPPGPVGEAFAERGYDIEELLVVPESRFLDPAVSVDFPDPESYDALVPMGAPWSVYDHGSIGTWVGHEIEFLRRAHVAGVPILGICFGGQALAAALGGSVVPSDRSEIGWVSVETSRPDLVEPGPWFQWHSDRWVLPDSVAAFARSEVSEQAFVAGRSLGLQFHPELTVAQLSGWLGNGGHVAARAAGLQPDDLLRSTAAEEPAAVARARALVHRFLDQVACADP
jgi:GMP synthase-like glutamine amidotransferase